MPIGREFSALFEDEKFLTFVEKFRTLEKEAKETGVDISEALKYLENGEGSPSSVKKALSELARKKTEILEKETGERNLISSEGESKLILAKVKYRYERLLTEFELLAEKREVLLEKLTRAKEKYEKRGSQPGRETISKSEKGEISLEEILKERMPEERKSPVWELKVEEAKKEFQRDMRELLSERYELFSSLGKREKSGSEELDTVNRVDKIDQQLLKAARELAEKYEICWEEIFNPAANWRRQGPEEDTGLMGV